MLTDLVAYDSLNPQASSEAKTRAALANSAMSVLLALCVDPTSTNELKDISPDIVSIRKFTLDALSRTIKDGAVSEPVDKRYGRLYALADLCFRMIMPRFDGSTRKSSGHEVPTHMARLMLEKNFVTILTNALAEVDLNFPNAKVLISAILRPLESLYVLHSFAVSRNNAFYIGLKSPSR